MKLRKWTCDACGFIWFEPLGTTKSDINLDHGCPQGCDNAGRVVDEIEATENSREWVCWILSKEDIDWVAKKNGIKEGSSKDEYEAIARQFRKGLEWAMDDWEEILETAIEDVMEYSSSAEVKNG
jgi:hypothetical protein